MDKINLFTIGFTKKSAEQFFSLLIAAKVKRVLDIRLRNTSALAGFAKKEDLSFFLKSIGNIEYVHLPFLAPTDDLLDRYKQKITKWDDYEKEFVPLLSNRKVEEKVTRELLDYGCLLCSEEKPGQCHRRLVAEYLADKIKDVDVVHL